MTAPDHAAIFRQWWKDHLEDRQTGAARGLGARLRRADGVEALAEPAVQTLAAQLGTRDGARLYGVIRVLAELRGSGGESLPRALGGPEPKLSLARFQRLMRAEGEERTAALVRAIRAMGPAPARACAIGALGRDLWLWSDPVRARWTFDYFHAPVPGALDPSDAPEPQEADA